ncbi:MAG: diacylglycerol kinase family lipid kinase [Thermodesulfovibrionales bacterium]|nr:diacylglycerol kinase family lipid kinase [Thermodesulfovibrionales bacterium]
MKQTIFLIGNPAAGRNALRKINEAAAIIKNRGHNVEMLLTGKRGDAESFARQISSESGVQSIRPIGRLEFKNNSSLVTCHSSLLVIAAGGDGTYNEVINGIACTDIPMAILPLGTTNVLAKELNIPDDIEGALNIALRGKTQKVCLGRITLIPEVRSLKTAENSNTRHSSLVTRHFLLMAGIGYDGETVYGIKKGLKKYSGKGAYILSGLKTLMRWAPDKLTFTMDGKSCEGYSAIICKISKYAGNFRIAPDADIKNADFYAFIMHGRNRLDILRYISGILTKKHLKFKDITYQQAENIEVKGNAHIQIDGDYFGMTPAKIEIVPDALRLVY